MIIDLSAFICQCAACLLVWLNIVRLDISQLCVSGTWMSEYRSLNCTATNTALCVWYVFTHIHCLRTTNRKSYTLLIGVIVDDLD